MQNSVDSVVRCGWCLRDPLYIHYHDCEWGVPVHEDRKLFEFLTLEAFQAGLSWLTILKKRDNFRRAFSDFAPSSVARFGEQDIERLMADPGIVRNRQKIEASVANARAFLEIQRNHGSFNAFIWSFVDGHPLINHWKTLDEIPAKTPMAETISRDLKKRGFRFVGPTIVYAHMQATGMVNDHLIDCYRHAQLS